MFSVISSKLSMIAVMRYNWRYVGKRKNTFACLFSVHNIISLSRHEQVRLIKYV